MDEDADTFSIPEFLRLKPRAGSAAEKEPSRRFSLLRRSLAVAATTLVVCVGVYAAEGAFNAAPRPPRPAVSPSATELAAGLKPIAFATAAAPEARAAAPAEIAQPVQVAQLADVSQQPAQVAQLADVAQQPAQVAQLAQPAEPAALVAQTEPVRAALEVHGADVGEIRFGMVSPFTGANREAGQQLKIGVETAFAVVNDAGGVNGRKLRLIAADDGYEPTRTLAAVRDLYEKKDVIGFLCDFGTATASVALPYALDNRALFFGALSGASLLRRDPPDRYVFNYRPSYGEETAAAVRYLTRVRRIAPREIAVFAQDDAFGDAGYEGVAKTLRGLSNDAVKAPRLGYKRNTIDVNDAAKWLTSTRNRIKAVVMVATYRAAAKFIEKTRDALPEMIYTNVSAVGATALAEELKLLGPLYADGVVVTQVTPSVASSASSVLKYKSALGKYFPGQEPDYTSFEAYIDAEIVIEALRRSGRDVDTEKLVDTLESMRDLDLGLGAKMHYDANDHQASHKVWGTRLGGDGAYQPIDLE